MNGWSNFRDSEQLARVCQAILAPVGLGKLWSGDGPRPESLGYRRSGTDEQPRDGRLMLMTAWAIWSRNQALSLADLLDLEDEKLRVVGELLAALSQGPDEIEAWLRRAPPNGHTNAGLPAGLSPAPDPTPPAPQR
jgi:hypothetical protein